MKKLSLTRKDLEDFASNTLGFQKPALRRMSTIFLGQLLQLQLTGDNVLNRMAREVECLERDQPGARRIDRCDYLFNGSMNEWIVFKRFRGTNYYLTLARLNDGDHSIKQRVSDAYHFDFPYLRGNA